jgi:hypothetical protein
MPAAFGEVAKRGDMRLLARRGGQCGSGFIACPRDGNGGGLGGQAVNVTLEDMRHDEAGIGRDRRLRVADRIADEAAQHVQRVFVLGDALGAGAGKWKSK